MVRAFEPDNSLGCLGVLIDAGKWMLYMASTYFDLLGGTTHLSVDRSARFNIRSAAVDQLQVARVPTGKP
jgi:hypothetical protein